MLHSTRIAGLGFYVPERVVKNDDSITETSDTDPRERDQRTLVPNVLRRQPPHGCKSCRVAIERAGIT